MNILLAKSALSGLLLVVWLAAWLWLRSDERTRRLSKLGTPIWWALTRLTPWFAVYVLAHQQPQSDVATAYWPHAIGVLQGLIPYRDFECFFGPLFPYLMAAPVLIWRDPRAIVLFLSLLEAVAVALTLNILRLRAPSPERTRLLALYFLAPGPLLLAIVGGQEDFLFWLLGILLWQFLRRDQDLLAGASTVIGIALTKPTFVIPAAIAFGLARRRGWFLVGAVPMAAITLALLWGLTGSSFLRVMSQGNNISPPNLWIWLHALSGGYVSIAHRWLSLSTVAASALFALWIFTRNATLVKMDVQAFAAAWTVVFAVWMLVSVKSLGSYFGYFAMPALVVFLQANRPLGLVAWVVMGAIAPVECSLWFRLGEPLITRFPDTPALVTEYGLQGVMLACLLYFASQAGRMLRPLEIATKPRLTP